MSTDARTIAQMALRVLAAVNRRDGEIEVTSHHRRQRLVLLSAERRTLLWVLDMMDAELRAAQQERRAKIVPLRRIA